RGGAIFDRGALTITNDTFTANTAQGGAGGPNSGAGGGGLGGAIFYEGSDDFHRFLRITHSTLSRNTARRGAGGGTTGAAGQGLGGALFNYNGQSEVTLSTFSGDTVIQGNGATLFEAGREIYSLDDSTLLKTVVEIDQSIVGQSDTSVSEVV